MKSTKIEIANQKWEKYFIVAKRFYKINNHLLMPNNYIFLEKNIGKWLGTQRTNYLKRNNPFFTNNRINALESIGII